MADWVPAFIDHTAKQGVPVDFVSSHAYADDTVEDLFHTHEEIPTDQRVCRAIEKVHNEISTSALPNLPLMWTEWNVPSFDALQARDTVYVGPALADDIRQCDGLVSMMSFWTFDDVFEEDGVVKEPFYGGFGLVASGRNQEAQLQCLCVNASARRGKDHKFRVECAGQSATRWNAGDCSLESCRSGSKRAAAAYSF